MMLDSKKCGYRYNKNVFEFYCYRDNYPDLQDFESVYVTGTFNGWLKTGDSAWLMKKTKEQGKVVYVLEKTLETVSVPGNSGFPEFKFFGLSDNSCHILGEKKGAENIFLGNKLILLSDSEFEEVRRLNETAVIYRNLDSFDLNCPACRAELANFRRCPGTKALFRGYHPYKRSRGWMDSEDFRIELVRKGIEMYGIKSDITLSGYETASELAAESPCDLITKMEKDGNRLCVNVDYNLVYFHSDAAEYLNTLQRIAKFIIEHNGPYYIHCRLGSDRTGVTTAVFSGLCGADWNTLAEDYERTNECGIGEFRNRKLLLYSLKKLTGVDILNSDDLSAVFRNLFINEGLLKEAEIDKLIKKLNTDPKKKETDYFDFSGRHICAKKSANR